MVSARAIQALVDGGDRYLVRLQRRRNPTAQAVLHILFDDLRGEPFVAFRPLASFKQWTLVS